MNSKKILFLANANSIHTVKWIDYFVDRNYDVHLATFSKNNRTKCKNIYFLGKKSANVTGGNYHYLLSISKLSKILKEVKPSFVNAHYSYSMGLVLWLSKKISKIKTEFSVVCHGSDILDMPIPFIFDRVNRYVLNRADKVFTVSDQIKDKIKSFNIDENKIFVGQYGINIDSSECKQSIDIISNRTYNENSKIDFLLETIDEMKLQTLRIVFILPTISPDRLIELEKKYSYIEFYDYVEYSEMLKFLCESKVYISATKSDGTSLSLLEAIYMECIPVISNIVSNRSWVLDGINGYLFNNKKDFKDKLKKALKNSRNSEMIKINKILIEDRASYNTQMKQIEKFLVESL